MPPTASYRDPEAFMWAVGIIGLIVVLSPLIVRLLRRSRAVEAPSSTRAPAEPARPDDTPLPLCDCGAVADRPAAEIIPRANWIDRLRRSFGMPPRYTINVPTGESEAPPVFCQIHGRSADTFVDEELAVAVVVERKAAESRIVQRVATFITGGLRARVLESLTKEQRDALKNRGRVKPAAALAEVVPINRAASGD